MAAVAAHPLGPLVTMADHLLLDLPEPAGFRRVLTAIGRGARRYSEIENLSGQRIDNAVHALEAGRFIERRHPLGEPFTRHRSYAIGDGHLSFWFGLIEPNRQLIEAGQGHAVLRAKQQVWRDIVARTFEEAARHHAARMVLAGTLLADLLIGEWWTDRPQQVQVYGVGTRGNRWALVGEAKWTDRFGLGELRAFDRNLHNCGDPAADTERHLWLKTLPDAAANNALGPIVVHDPADVLRSVEELAATSAQGQWPPSSERAERGELLSCGAGRVALHEHIEVNAEHAARHGEVREGRPVVSRHDPVGPGQHSTIR